MTDAEKREAARQFCQKWVGKGKEDEDDRSYWLDILQRIMGIEDATDRIEFQKKVVVDGNTKRIDAYIPETRILIEQKTLGIGLDKKAGQSGGAELTPYEQAKRYDNNLSLNEHARYIVTSNFEEIWIYDMTQRTPEPEKLLLKNLPDQYSRLDFLIARKPVKISQEMELSIKAGELIGKIHDRFLEQYNDPLSTVSQHSLNKLCVRLVFCMYAEDAGLFPSKNYFQKYMMQYEAKDFRKAMMEVFRTLDTPEDQRDEYIEDDLNAFPYVNGGLFKDENIVIPKITDDLRETILRASDFDWSVISPTIFGAVFESTLNPDTRRAGGMHYTSIENIHKVIDPLFLDDLKKEFEDIKSAPASKTAKDKKLQEFQIKLSKLKFLDPACGSGNFLTETYVSIRRLENEIIKELNQGQMVFGTEGYCPIKVSIDQFYGIEINDFAVTVAKTALWIAESQMMKETESIMLMNLNFLPLKTNATVIEGNALRIDWERVVPKSELSYIMGNPPFVGARWMSKEQKDDVINIFGAKWKNVGDLDYVCCWYKKAVDVMKNTIIRTALVSTNSITQGGSVIYLWKPLFEMGIHIDYAYRTFNWSSEANNKAHVHCVIVGYSVAPSLKPKYIYSDDVIIEARNINAYLADAENIFVDKRQKPISDVPQICLGGQPIDDGNLILTLEEYEAFLKEEPQAEPLIRHYMMGRDFIDRKPRYCLWMKGLDPSLIKKCPKVLDRIQKVKEFRQKSDRSSTLKAAETPMLFAAPFESTTTYVAIPKVSSSNRRYIPMDFLKPEIIPGDKLFVMQNAGYYEFGIMTSNVHNAWMRVVCGRLKSDYSYSNTIVYNNFPWPTPTDEQKAKIEKTAQAILDARALYPDCSLADLYDPLTMPQELRKAHQENDKAVMRAYGLDIKTTSEADCVAFLMKMYQELTKDK